MALGVGTKLGPYEVLAPLGAGGMGEVYRGRDTKLNRDVALKVLPEAVADDPERLARFRREAQVLAALNHPNIATVHGFEGCALVMELVEGATLAERIAHGPIPLEEALPIALQIAQALEAAHEKNIIHRDLKPANVKITPEGNVKVLDFGLAKALEENPAVTNGANSPTVSAMPTRAGIILGTAAYMSPEQGRGVAVDRRADIWSFGAVMFEMLSGRPPFQGETTSDVLASVLKFDPDWDVLPASTPSSIDRLLHRCLTKNSKQRLQAMGDARIEIEDALAALLRPPTSTVAPEATARVLGTSRLLRPSALVLVMVLLSLSLLAGMWFQSRRVALPSAWSGDLLGGPSIAFGPRISPDGHTIAFQAMVDTLTQVAVMNADSGNWTLLTHDRTRGYVSEIGWSRDGSKLYFDRVLSQPQGIYSVPSLGGEEHLVLEAAETPEVLPDGSLVVARIDSDRRARIYHYWPDSGQIQSIDAWPLKLDSLPMRVSPDGTFVVFLGTVKEARPDGAPHLYALNIATGRTRQLAPQSLIRLPSFLFPLAVTPDNRSVLVDLPSGDLHQVVAVPISGSGPVRALATLTKPPWFIDVSSDGSLFIDQIDRPQEVLRFPLSGGTPEIIGGSEAFANIQPVEFPDGRFLMSTIISGRPRLLIGRPGGNFTPLVDTAEPTAPPATLLANDEVAFIAGKGPDQSIVIGSASEGRIVRRLQGVSGNEITSLAASPEGRTIYYVASGSEEIRVLGGDANQAWRSSTPPPGRSRKSP